MPLFKIVAHNRVQKVLVAGTTMKDVINKGKQKLALPDAPYRIVLDDDGTEVDDDDVLAELGKGSPLLTLMLLGAEETWPKPRCASQAIENPQEIERSNCDDENVPYEPVRDVPEYDIGLNVWSRFPRRLLKSCEDGQRAIASDRRSVVMMLAAYMIDELKDTSRRTAYRIAKHVVTKHPNTFGDQIAGQVIGAGSESFGAQLYNAVNYRKPKSAVDDHEAVDSPAAPLDVSRKHDEYGCLEYEPLLPENESTQSQEEKRLSLQALFNSQNKDDKDILELSSITYATQRLTINAKHRNLTKFFEDWPCFTESCYLIAHGSRLLGKDIKEEWDTQLEAKSKITTAYFRSTYRRRLRKRKAEKEPTTLDNVATKGLDILSESERSITAERSVMPTTVVMFPLLVNYFQETPEELWRVDAETASQEEPHDLQPAIGPYPTLLVRGKSLYDDEATISVIIDNCAIRAPSVSEGFLTLIAAYYVFGFVYPKKVCRTLEYIQRTFLGINPQTGHKHAGKQRKNVTFDPKVLTLSNSIELFAKDFQVD